MKTSCIQHPAKEPLIIIRKWQYEFCEDDVVAAALMSFFEYWHNIKLESKDRNKKFVKIAQENGEEIELDISLYQFHKTEDLIAGLVGIAKSKNTVNRALDYLVSRRVISIHSNPNPRYAFDNTRHFLFHPAVCQEYLSLVKFDGRSVKIDGRSVKSDRRPVNFDRTSPESSCESSYESSTQRESSALKISLSEFAFQKWGRQIADSVLVHIIDPLEAAGCTAEQLEKIKRRVDTGNGAIFEPENWRTAIESEFPSLASANGSGPADDLDEYINELNRRRYAKAS